MMLSPYKPHQTVTSVESRVGFQSPKYFNFAWWVFFFGKIDIIVQLLIGLSSETKLYLLLNQLNFERSL